MEQSKRELEAELLRQYITPELRERAKTDKEAWIDIMKLEMIAEIDADTIWWARVCSESNRLTRSYYEPDPNVSWFDNGF